MIASDFPAPSYELAVPGPQKRQANNATSSKKSWRRLAIRDNLAGAYGRLAQGEYPATLKAAIPIRPD
jgi:hypothetical protein